MVVYCSEPGISLCCRAVVISLASFSLVEHLRETRHESNQLIKWFAESSTNEVHNVCHAGYVK